MAIDGIDEVECQPKHPVGGTVIDRFGKIGGLVGVGDRLARVERPYRRGG